MRAAVRGYLEAVNARALDRVLAYYAETAVLELPASPPAAGRAAIRRAFEAFFGQWEEQSTYDRVVVEGETAAVEGVTVGRHRTLHLHIPGRAAAGPPRYRHRFAAFMEFADARELVRQLLG